MCPKFYENIFSTFGHSLRLLPGYIDSLELEVVVPPPTSKATLDIGVRYCPEMICTPGKIIFGNYVEAAHFCSDSSGGAW